MLAKSSRPDEINTATADRASEDFIEFTPETQQSEPQIEGPNGTDKVSGRLLSSVLAEFSGQLRLFDAVWGEVMSDPEFRAASSEFQGLLDGKTTLQQFPLQSALDDQCASPEYFRLGTTVLDFHLIDVLGRGAFSTVFLATDGGLGNRFVVIKCTTLGSDEAHLLGKLRHRGVMPIHSVRVHQESGQTILCMPFLSRCTLRDILEFLGRRGRRPRSADYLLQILQQMNQDTSAEKLGCKSESALSGQSYLHAVRELGAQIAEALAYTHAKGIAHGDLKPSNVLITPEAAPILLDFNLSTGRYDTHLHFGGTIAYMAPERINALIIGSGGAHGTQHVASDLYSLGTILYELACGDLPFGPLPDDLDGKELARYLYARQSHGPEPLRKKNKRVSRRLAGTIEACLAFSEADRPPSATELARQLRVRPNHCRLRWSLLPAQMGPALSWLASALLLMAVGAWFAWLLR